jgi:prophage regulatory protein
MEKFYGKKEVLKLYPVSSVTLWREIRRGNFPAPVRISVGRVGWTESAITEWQKAKCAKPAA